MKKINIGLLGLGTVGLNVYKTINQNSQIISDNIGAVLNIKKILCRNISKERLIHIKKNKLTTNYLDIINDEEIDIVVEVVGGVDHAKKICFDSVKKGKHIVTANKALLAQFGNQLFKMADEERVMIGYEASVCGGVPVIKILGESLSANNITAMVGIINGTSNYVLSEMKASGISFGTALKNAQNLGYAEADSTFDINGLDASHKIAILSAIGFKIPIDIENVLTEGIQNLKVEDIENADQFGYDIKLLAIAKRKLDYIELRVHPTLISKKSIISNVNGAMNALLIVGDIVGQTLYYGAGAGGKPTASAVVSDIINISKKLDNISHIRNSLYEKSNKLLLSKDFNCSHYLRLLVEDKPGVLAQVTQIFSDFEISIESILQKDSKNNNQFETSIIIITHETSEKRIKKALNLIKNLKVVKDEIVRIRIENFL